jgi:hypothetical protein
MYRQRSQNIVGKGMKNILGKRMKISKAKK